MSLRIIITTLALMLIPTASASTEPLDAPAIAVGRIIDTGQVQLTITLGGQHLHGEVLSLCPDSSPVPDGYRVLGTHDDTCFHILHVDAPSPPSLVLRGSAASATTAIVGGVGPVPVCGPVGVSILPHGGPPVYVEPDEACINAIINEVLG